MLPCRGRRSETVARLQQGISPLLSGAPVQSSETNENDID